MKKIIILLSGLLIANLCYSLTAEEILQKADDNRSLGTNFDMLIKMEDYRKGQMSDNTTLKGFVKGQDKSMVVFTEPANMKGRKILMINDDMWIFIPNTQKPVRLTASQRLLGQASNGDVVKVQFSYDYSSVLSGEETIQDIDSQSIKCFRLNLTAKRSGATYNKLTLWVGQGTYYPVKAEFFALSGKKLKTAFYSDPKEMEGHIVITKMTIYDEIIKDNYTTMEYMDLKIADVPDKYFNKEYLQRM